MKTDDISKLNDFLKGIHMGLHGFKNHSEKTSNPQIQDILKSVYETYENHESLISKKIEELGGTPHHDLGVTGAAFKIVENLKELSIKNEAELITKARTDIETAIKMTTKFLAENPTLSQELVTIIKGIQKDNEDLLTKINSI